MALALPKRRIGRVLYALAEAAPVLRPGLRRWGLRTQPGWFPGRVPTAVSRLTGHRLKLASFSANYLSFELFWRGLDYYEPLTTALIAELGGATGLFVDVGANIGYHSLRAAAAHPALEIVAFEPHPRLHALLAANVRANGLARITPEPIALSNCDGIRPFYLSRSDMSASLERTFAANQDGVVSVAVATLDDYLRRKGGAPAGFLLKVDVEGHEPAFFEGAEQTLRRCRPEIIAEVTEPYPAGTLALLERCGYGFHQITDEGLRPCAEPTAYLRDSLVFLNGLFSTRPAAELAPLSALLRARARAIDLHRTSKRADHRVVERCQRTFAPAPERGRPVRSLAALPGRWPGPQTR